MNNQQNQLNYKTMRRAPNCSSVHRAALIELHINGLSEIQTSIVPNATSVLIIPLSRKQQIQGHLNQTPTRHQGLHALGPVPLASQFRRPSDMCRLCPEAKNILAVLGFLSLSWGCLGAVSLVCARPIASNTPLHPPACTLCNQRVGSCLYALP